MWQTLIVFCIVAAAIVHAGTKYLPASWRQRVGRFLTRIGARQPAAWFNAKSGCADGCSNCSSKPCAAPAASPQRVIKLHVQPRQ